MSAEKKHDYHLVDPSPWPIYVSFSCLVLAIGTIFYMHNDVSWGMYLGLALVLYGAYMWFRDVVIEAEHQGHHTPVVQIHHRYGMTLFIASEVMYLNNRCVMTLMFCFYHNISKPHIRSI